ncbi:MAG: tripartite tricarboxylate transporter permease [Lachnospiraceae bacterium]|nr:tripartite tricarboxylate transporter permease [Lachnospiraceae bacterium]
MLQDLINALTAVDASCFIWILVGLSVGIMVGALPGLNPSTGIAIMLPFTYTMQVGPALVMLTSLYFGATFGGSISAILIGVPGTTSSVPTVWDGHAMQKKGEGAKAMGIAAIASMIGGVIGSLLLIVLTNQLADVALAFGNAEYFAICIFGLSIVSRLSGDNMAKCLLSMLLGLLLATVGVDPLWGATRFTFGISNLLEGIDFMPMLIGSFALVSVMKIIEAGGDYNKIYKTQSPKMSKMIPKWREFKHWIRTCLMGSLIGTFIGVLPGAGPTISSFISYNQGKSFSKHPELYGTGYGEAICASESANNSAAPGAIAPMLALGVPGSGSAALLMTAFIMQGIRPGPQLFVTQADLLSTITGSCFYANLLLLVVAIAGIKIWSRIVSIPNNMLIIMMLLFGMMGSFSVNYNMFSVLTMIVAGILGYFLDKCGVDIGPMTLGIVLGYMVEINFRRALQVSNMDVTTFFTSPISAVFLALAVISVVSSLIPGKKQREAKKKTNQEE